MPEKPDDERYMSRAFRLAEGGVGRVGPNPVVGCVIVKDGAVIGEGYHEKYGGPHAERNALDSCRVSPEGSALYVTLEPCRHHGKTPPCTDAIIKSGIKRVVIGCLDPNPQMNGESVRLLQERGIDVTTGVLKRECARQNEVFFHYITTKTPFVTLKYAMTIDGKLATKTGASKWITGEPARRRVHEDRNRYSAVLTGVGTILTDDPLLTCRIDGGRNPLRVICDTKLRTPLSSQIISTAREVPTILATSRTDNTAQKPFINAGCEIIEIPEKDGHIDLTALMKALGGRGLDSVFIEGGGALNWSALESGIVNRIQSYIAPKIFGGAEAPSPVAGLGAAAPDGAFALKNSTVTILGDDFLIESEVL